MINIQKLLGSQAEAAVQNLVAGDIHQVEVNVETAFRIFAAQHQQRLQREIEATDKAIDQLVYELHGLSDEEIRIVEGK